MTSRADRPLVLLADDFEDARDLYREYLEMHGFRVVTAADGPSALERAREATPAAIFLDIGMPRMSGLDVARAIKADPRFAGVPVVALSAHALAAERDLFLASGFDAVLPKPCLPDTLLQTARSLVTRT